MSTSLFNRTVKTNIILFKSNGKDRDGYISYNSGGFWKENIKPAKEIYPHSPFNVHYSLEKIPPICTYHSDGSGRDSYVVVNSGGLVKKYNSLAENIRNFLRDKKEVKKEESLRKVKIKYSRDEKLYLRKINKIQKDLVDRLYNNINSKKNLRKRIIYNDRMKKDGNISNDSKIDNSFTMNTNNINESKINNLIRSSSQIYNKKFLEPIKCYNNSKINCSTLLKNHRKLILNNRNINSLSSNNIIKSNINNSKNDYYFTNKFIFDTSKNKFIKYPKVKCYIESIDNNKIN